MDPWDAIGVPTEEIDDLSAPVDYAEEPHSPETAETADTLSCRDCGKPLEYSGRGRKPTRCDDCKTKPAGRSGGKPRATRKGDAKLAEIRESTQEGIAFVGILTSGPLPVTGLYITERSDRVAAAIVDLARNHPAILKALEKAKELSSGAELAAFALGVAVAIQVDSGKIENPREFMLANALGITNIWNQVHGVVPAVS